MKEEICKCGHEGNKHYISAHMENGCYPRKECDIKSCDCKEFVSQEESA